MPLYEYRCHGCGRKVTLLVRQASAQPQCPRCGGRELSRLMSSFAVMRSEDSRLESLSDPGAWGDLSEDDPQSMVRMARKLKHEMGEEAGPEIDEMVDKLEAGESLDEDGGDDGPEDVES